MLNATLIVLASWYAVGLPNPEGMTVASRTYPRGTRLELRVDPSKPWLKVVVNDIGPDKRIFPERGLDVSRGVARKLGMLKRGLALVEVRVAK